MESRFSSYVMAMLTVGLVALITTAALPMLGLASSALLFLLPVLLASVRSGIGPGLLAAVAGGIAYNFLLLPPRFSLAIHGFDHVISLIVLVTVALVTSSLAMRLKLREQEALDQVADSREAVQLSALLAEADIAGAPERGAAWLAQLHGHARLLHEGGTEGDAAFTSLDHSAAAWALHNGDMTGHGTSIMPAAEWSFIPLSLRNWANRGLLAIARPEGGGMRSESQLAHLRSLALLVGQACDRAELEQQRQARETMEHGDRLRRALLASLAHDFRTPLTVITGQLATLSAKSPEAREALTAAHRLNRTIEDLLGAARLEHGALAPSLESLDLVDVVASACDAATRPAAIQLDRAIPADLPFVIADPVLLHHVLLNLLDNAARHATTVIHISAQVQAQEVLLAIADDGPGIPEDERERLFDQFARAQGSDRTQGSGLGLSIVKGFAEAMGIAITISAAPDGGACFTLAIPQSLPSA